MDNLDKMILEILKEDARISYQTIATMLNVDAATVEERVKAMQAAGIIVKFAAVVNSEAACHDHVSALIEVKVTPQSTRGFDDIAKEIMAYDEVSSVYLMSGVFDLVVIIEGKSLRDVSRFISEKLSAMDNIISIATHFMLKKYKSEGVVLDGTSSRQREELV